MDNSPWKTGCHNTNIIIVTMNFAKHNVFIKIYNITKYILHGEKEDFPAIVLAFKLVA